MAFEELKPKGIAPPFASYAHGVSLDMTGQKLIATSGQLGMAKDGSIPDSVEDQARLCFGNIDAILAEAGGSASSVLRINAFVTDRSFMPGYMAVRDEWLADVTPLPASTLMIVTGFTKPEFKVEIEVLAAVASS